MFRAFKTFIQYLKATLIRVNTMTYANYASQLPLPSSEIPETLRNLLEVETTSSPSKKVQITTNFEKDQYGDRHEALQMIMACVPENELSNLGQLNESSEGVVSYSKPICDNKGDINSIKPSISGYDYIVASWGDGQRYSYSLAEKVWMTLGLSPRVKGNSVQKVTYDDLSKPIIDVANGDFASQYYFHSSRDIKWEMRNDYLRKYLWMNGCWGVRVFYYETYIKDTPAIRKLFGKDKYFQCNKPNSWYDLILREHQSKILLQIHATVPVVSPERCDFIDKYSLVWAGDGSPMSKDRASCHMKDEHVYVDDRFLEKYERNSMFECTPFKRYTSFSSCPSYGGQWAFRDCERVGRNMLKVSIYELYRGVPSQEILHVHKHAISALEAKGFPEDEEHIVCKSFRLLETLIDLSENLATLAKVANGTLIRPVDFVLFDRQEYNNEGISNFSIIKKLSQVAPLDMYEQDFLARCKTLNEIINRFKIVPLRKVLISLGAKEEDTLKIQGIRLFQALFNILDDHNSKSESHKLLHVAAKDINITSRNAKIAPLFINNDLRNAEAHESIGKSLEHLENLGFDISSVSEGYGHALDYILDSVTDALIELNTSIQNAIHR
ncbi:hypothetical protein [Shewanella sp. 6_MG-2023]|uniref:hypothetical protein n=1 Tax=Shewanella sp. 6_MG-2023 TaxID=3062660 RepID=UPI0026E442E7|nr:hypothetical protein [Shewanella sp. 6_MG-2023]MDO6620238.1 hypothetical protein [Shewanella sp. 6_MG-2023]